MAAPTFTEEEFSTFYRPSDALKMLPDWGDHARQEALAMRFRAGLLGAVAEHLTEGEGSPRLLCPISRALWQDWAWADERAFWERGDCRFLKWSSGGYGTYPSNWSAYNVRIEPINLHLYLDTLSHSPDRAAGTKAASPDTRPTLSLADQRKFCDVYLGVHGESATERDAYRAVIAVHPERKVSRDPFLALFRSMRGPQVPGRKRKTGEL